MSKQSSNTPKMEIKSEDIDFEALNNPNLVIQTEETPVLETPKEEIKKPEAEVKIDDKPIDTPVVDKTEISEESSGIVNTIFENLQSSLGIEFNDSDLEGVELTEDLETVNKIAALSGKKYGEKVFNDLVNSHPDIQKAINYIKANGSLNGIEEATVYPDYSQADLSSEQNQEVVYRNYLSLKGIDGEDADGMITLAKDKGELNSKSENAKKALVDYFKGLESESTSKNAKVIADRQAEQQQLVSEISEAIDSGKILGVTLSKVEIKEFKDYLLKPVDKQGRTAKQIYDEQDYTLEQELYNELLKFKKFAGMTPKVDKKIKTLKSLVEANKGRKTEIGNSEMTTGNFNTGNEIDWEALEKLPIGGRKQIK